MAQRQGEWTPAEKDLEKSILRQLDRGKIASGIAQALEDQTMLGPFDQLINDILGRTEIGDLPAPPSPPTVLIMKSLETESPGSRERVKEELKGVRRRRRR
jgi:hypothetical protein